MTDIGASAKARATMHLTVTREDGTVEEYDIPVETDLTKEQVLEMIRQHDDAQRSRCGEPARVAVGDVLLCDDHLQAIRIAAGNTIARVHAPGLCMHPKES